MPTAYLSPSLLQDLTNVSVSPGAGNTGYPLVWNNTSGRFELAPINFLSGATPLIFSTGPTTGTIRERTRIHPNGATIYSSDGIGAFAVASFGKNNIPDNTVTPLARFVARNNSVYGLVHAYFSVEDIGHNLFLAERVYVLFWNGGVLFFTQLSDLGFTYGPMPAFSVAANGNTVTLSGTYDSISNNGWSISMAFQWIPYAYDLADLSIEKA